MLQDLLAMISSKKDSKSTQNRTRKTIAEEPISFLKSIGISQSEELRIVRQTVAGNHDEDRHGKVSPGLVMWHPDYQSACLAASRSRKPILLFQMMGSLDDRYCGTNARLARTVLFSAPEIALFIMSNFEAAWQSVGASPTVHIDFGNGAAVTGTLHGNIATYVCTADGDVLDIMPGIYDPKSYLHGLEQLKLLNEMFINDGWAGVSGYHREQTKTLSAGLPRKVISRKIEKPIESAEDGSENANAKSQSEVFVLESALDTVSIPSVPSAHYLMPQGEELREWEMLDLDRATKEGQRRKMIHGYLMNRPGFAPCEMTKWLYREVLHADLDDPYLGLKPLMVPRDPVETSCS